MHYSIFTHLVGRSMAGALNQSKINIPCRCEQHCAVDTSKTCCHAVSATCDRGLRCVLQAHERHATANTGTAAAEGRRDDEGTGWREWKAWEWERDRTEERRGGRDAREVGMRRREGCEGGRDVREGRPQSCRGRARDGLGGGMCCDPKGRKWFGASITREVQE